MSWYKTGTVAVTTGSNIVTGTGADFIAGGIQAGDDLRIAGAGYEIAEVIDATHLKLAAAWYVSSASGLAYAIVPTQSRSAQIARQLNELLATTRTIIGPDGHLSLPDGSLTPDVGLALSYLADPDTGLRRSASGTQRVVANGVDVAEFGPSVSALLAPMLLVGTDTSVGAGMVRMQVGKDGSATSQLLLKATGGHSAHYVSGLNVYHSWASGGFLAFGTAPTDGSTFDEFARFDPVGNLVVGATTSDTFGSAHRIAKSTGEGGYVLSVDGGAGREFSSLFSSVSVGGYSYSDSAVKTGRNSVTNRSINAGGTINASGADYAEYERANGIPIVKGDVVGYAADGTLTMTYADAMAYGIKSTDPGIVGGDTWSSAEAIGEPPAIPPPPNPQLPPAPAVADHDAPTPAERAALSEWEQQCHDATVAAADAHSLAMIEYQGQRALFDQRLESARQQVDRVAYAGKVPVNVYGAAPGDYIVAAEGDDGRIVGAVVPPATLRADMSLYLTAVGRVRRIADDGRAVVAVIVH